MSTDAFAPAVFPRFRDADADADRRQARVRGYADGHAEGFRAGMAEAAAATEAAESQRRDADARARGDLADARAAVNAAAEALAARMQELTGVAEQQISARAVELAEVILAEVLKDRDLAAASALRRALTERHGEVPVEVRLSPADVRTLELLGALPERTSVVADDTLAPGDGVAVMADGIVDARVATALERARRVLAEETP